MGNSASMFLRRHRWTLLIGCYGIAYGFLLPLGNARFWDDWSSHSYNGVTFFGGQVFPFREMLDELTISKTSGFWLYRPLTFTAFGLTGIAVWGILGVPRGWLTQNDRYWITALFLLLPYNSVRAIVQGLYSYTFSHLLFFTAWYLLVSRRQWWWFLVSWLCFVLSFPTHSLLFYILLPALHCLMCPQLSQRGRILRFSILGLTSVLYRPLSGEIWSELRFNEGYNEIKTQFLIRALVVFFIINAVSLVVARRSAPHDIGSSRHRQLTAIGLFTFSAGLFPYMAVGHFPNLSDFLALFIPNLTQMHSRHSLLLPLGTAIAVVGIVRMVVRTSQIHFVLGAVAVVSTFLCGSIYLQYYTDGLKQQGIIDALSEDQVAIPTQAVEFRDLALRFNARGRSLYHWEYLGMLNESGLGTNFEIMDSGQYPCDSKFLANGTLVTITSTSGRLRAILTGDAQITLVANAAQICGPGLTTLSVFKLQGS